MNLRKYNIIAVSVLAVLLLAGSAFALQSPYAGVISLPGTVQAENYDNGGEGLAFHDTDTGNWLGAYRNRNR